MGDTIAADLTGAKEARRPWTQVAELLDRGLQRERQQGVNPHTGRFLPFAVKATGYSATLIYRYLAVWKFASAHLVPTDASWDALCDVPFASIELIKRVWDLDRRFARAALHDVLAGKISVRRLQAEVRSIEAKRQAQNLRSTAYTARQEAEAKIIDAIEGQYLETFSNIKEAQFVERTASILLHARADLAIVIEEHGRIEAVDGIELKTRVHIPMRARIWEMIARWLYSSTFYRRFWIVITPQTYEELLISEIQEALAEGSLNNIGVAKATVAKNGRVTMRVIRSPGGPPSPDRRPALIDALRKTMWKGVGSL